MRTHGYAPEVIDRTVAGMRASGFTCDSPNKRRTTRDYNNPQDQQAEDITELKEAVAQVKESVNSLTNCLGELRVNHQQLQQQVHTHQQLLTTSSSNADEGDNSEEGDGEGTAEGTTADQLRQINNLNRRRFRMDEITGPSAPNLAGKTGSISSNSSQTGQVLDLGNVWVGNPSAPTQDELTNYHRRILERTNDAIAQVQARQDEAHGVRKLSKVQHPHTLGEINAANKKTWGIK
jgi:hypothetical protein